MEVVASQSLWLSQYEAIFQEVLLRRDGFLLLKKKVLEYVIDFTKHQLGRENNSVKGAFKMYCFFKSVSHFFNQLDKYLNIVVYCAEVS